MVGKIIKGIAGVYDVHMPEQGLYACKAKGILRKWKVKPLVGDNVEFTILDEKQKTGNITEILPRKNELIRPAVANVDQALILFAAAEPEPNLNLLDRFLIKMEQHSIPVQICWNKSDLAGHEKIRELEGIYKSCGYNVNVISALLQEGLLELYPLLEGKTTTLAGPSGVGKSSVINLLYPDAEMEIGAVSEKIKRGKHTTRHSELFCLSESTYLMDTPGFSSLYLEDIEKEELKEYFPEFLFYQEGCRFQGCSHINEPDCAIKKALEEGKISRDRYKNYLSFYEELKQKKKYERK